MPSRTIQSGPVWSGLVLVLVWYRLGRRKINQCSSLRLTLMHVEQQGKLYIARCFVWILNNWYII